VYDDRYVYIYIRKRLRNENRRNSALSRANMVGRGRWSMCAIFLFPFTCPSHERETDETCLIGKRFVNRNVYEIYEFFRIKKTTTTTRHRRAITRATDVAQFFHLTGRDTHETYTVAFIFSEKKFSVYIRRHSVDTTTPSETIQFYVKNMRFATSTTRNESRIIDTRKNYERVSERSPNYNVQREISSLFVVFVLIYALHVRIIDVRDNSKTRNGYS